MRDPYREIADQIIAELKTGARPWIKQWSETSGLNLPANAVSGRPCSGVNTLLLWTTPRHGWSQPRFLTFAQALEVGDHVRKGEHGFRVVLVKNYVSQSAQASEQEEPHQVRFLKSYVVFNIAQCDGLPDKLTALPKPVNPHQRDAAIDAFIVATGATMQEENIDEAYFDNSKDCIVLPRFEVFRGKAEYYATEFHELIHWTGHAARLYRQLGARLGRSARATEELIAEVGAAFLCAEFSVDGFIPHAAYLEHYLKLLENDTKATFTAASRAQAAVDFPRDLMLREPAQAAE
jgi:antirestriction protein ArdC